MIISHKRANTQFTYEVLKKEKYTGKIFIVVDDKDPELNEYKKKYKDIIKVFSKDEMLKKTDTVDNFENKTNCVLPSRYLKQLAEELKLEYYMRMDDDVLSIRERYEENGMLKGRDIEDINKIFDLFIEYMEKTNISCLSFANEGRFIGGVSGKFSEGIGRNNTQTFLIKTKDNLQFLGTGNEDFNMVAKYSNIGKLLFEVYRISIKSPKRGSNEGGLYDDYQKSGLYTTNFYSIIVAPYCCKLLFKKDTITLKRNWERFAPKILSEVYKK